MAWLDNVFITSNGASISKQQKAFNLAFISFVQNDENEVLKDYIDSFEFTPSIVNITKTAIQFKLANGGSYNFPYSEFNFHKLTMWLIAQSTLNNLMLNYAHTIELMNTKFNVENIYSAKTKEAETFKLFLSVFHKQATKLKEKEIEAEELDFFKQNPHLNIFNFKADFSELLQEHRDTLLKIEQEVSGWDWKQQLGESEDGYRIEKILTSQLNVCVQQFLEMPAQYRENMKNHDNLSMNQLLNSNLSEILNKIQSIKNNIVVNQAKENLFKQSVQKTMLANQRNE